MMPFLQMMMASCSSKKRALKERLEEGSRKLTEKVVVSNVKVVDAIVGEAWCRCLAILLSLKNQGQELLDS
jgi:glycerol dehydrogenase-like iron-containing ADH family enzyme